MDARESSPSSVHERADDTIADEDLTIARVDRLRRGDTLGRYVVLDRIGAGAVGLVYAAYDPELDRRVAIKLLRTGVGAHPGSRRSQRLVREAQAMAKLAHPHVVTVHDVGTHGNRVFLAMEHVQGRTLGEWLKTRPSWPSVLEVFLSAGLGLAAAHAKGMVHRDFKPDNVMLGDDGRVLVMDFGLARVDEATESGSAGLPSEPTSSSPRITHTGAMLGTPAYMAPEQHLGRTVDARSDQFAFCVALFEGLYGVRPFAGNTPATVGMAIIEGRISDPPSGHGVPRWLHQALLRGLAREPDERYADMDELMRALQPAPRRRRTIAVLGLIGGSLLGGILWARSAVAPADDPCAGARDQLVDIWDEDRRQRVSDAMAGTGSPLAPDTITRVADRLDAYAEGWARMWIRSCEATRVRGEQSEALLDLRHACLDQRLRALDDLADVLEHADAEVVQRAVSAAAELPPLPDCADLMALRQALPPPADPELARAVKVLRDQLGGARVLVHAGRFTDAEIAATDARARASELDYPPALAEALAIEGEVLAAAGDHDGAVRALHQAYFSAVRSRHDEVAAEAAARLTYEVGYRHAQHEAGFGWGEHALALGLRVGEGELPEAEARHALGALADAAGRTELAAEHYRRAYELRVAMLPADHPDIGRSLNAMGNLHLGRAELSDALEDYRAALDLRETVYGPRHPEVAGSLNNISIVLRRQGELEGAADALRRALEIYEAAHGEDHPDVAQSRNNLGLTLREAGDAVAAESEHRRALAVRDRILEPEHPDRGDSLLGLGRALSDQGRHAEAEPALRRALELYERALGPEHPAVAEALVGLAAPLLERGAATEARDSLVRAIAILDARASESDVRAEAMTLLARARAAGGQPPPTDPGAPAPRGGSALPAPARDPPPAPAG